MLALAFTYFTSAADLPIFFHQLLCWSVPHWRSLMEKSFDITKAAAAIHYPPVLILHVTLLTVTTLELLGLGFDARANP